jgi:uncharacterized RDD family membrane protein YckC
MGEADPPYAGFWVRTAAAIIDFVVLSVAVVVMAGIVHLLYSGTSNPDVATQAVMEPIAVLLPLVYFMVGWVRQTPGMAVFRLRVVRAQTGDRIDPGTAFVRALGLLISIDVLFLGVLWVAFDRRKQGWHDKFAGTIVVRAS